MLLYTHHTHTQTHTHTHTTHTHKHIHTQTHTNTLTHKHTHTGYESALTAPDDPASSLSPTQSSVTTFGRKGTVHKDINRFTSFVKTGTEGYILGKVSAKATDADKITIVVSYEASGRSLGWGFRGLVMMLFSVEHNTCMNYAGITMTTHSVTIM